MLEHLRLYLTAVPSDASHSSIEGPFQSPRWTPTVEAAADNAPCQAAPDLYQKMKIPSQGVASFLLQPHLPQCREDAGGSLAKCGNGLLPLPGIPDKKCSSDETIRGEFINHKGLTLVTLSLPVTESLKVEKPLLRFSSGQQNFPRCCGCHVTLQSSTHTWPCHLLNVWLTQ